MAELSTQEPAPDLCCAAEQQTTCCEPRDKADCCGHSERCECATGETNAAATDQRER